jgi:polyferredoxin
MNQFSMTIRQLEEAAEAQIRKQKPDHRSGLAVYLERLSTRILKNPLYPWVGRWVMIGLLVLMSYAAIFGPRDPHQNFATILSWVVWWPLLATSYLLVGRVWCAVCPMGTISDILQRKVGLNLKTPRLLTRRWVVVFVFVSAILSLAWLEEVTRASVSPFITGFILWTFTVGASVSGLLFERWTWCRHLCPLGAISGAFSMSSMFEVRANQNVCLANRCTDLYCYFGRDEIPGCPLKQIPKVMDSNIYCTMCGNCLKACPNDAISVRLRFPGNECVKQKHAMPEHAFMAVIMLGVVAFQTFVFTEFWSSLRSQLMQSSPLFASDGFVYGLLLLISVILPAGLFYLVARLYAYLSKQHWTTELTRFGLAFLPLALMAHIGHNLNHFFSSYRFIPYAISNLLPIAPQAAAHTPDLIAGWHWFEIIFILIGLGITMWSLRKICLIRQESAQCHFDMALPFVGFALLFTIIFIILLLLPMAYRV